MATNPEIRRMCEDPDITTEDRAVAILKALRPRAQVVATDVGRGGHDLEIRYGDGRCEAVEVTEATKRALRTAKAAHSKWLPEAAIPGPQLTHDWHLYATERAIFKTLDVEVPPLLQKVEQIGLLKFFYATDALHHSAVADLWTLGIDAGFRWNPKPHPRIVISPPGDRTIWKEPVGDPGRYLIERVELEAAKPDNSEKLRFSGCEKGHLFLWVDERLYTPWRDMAIGRIPERLPSLPEGIDLVWTATCTPGGHLRVWSVEPPHGWQSWDAF